MLPTPQLLNKIANFIQERGKCSYYCLFLLGKEAGLRVSEAVNFNLSLKKNQNLYLIHSKNHKKRTVFIDPTVIKTLKKINWKPNQTNRFSYTHYLQRVKKELNISKNIELTPHTLRRCFATYQANSGMPLPVLQQVLGHSSIRTTALYWKETNEPKEKAISDKWLAGKLPPELPKSPINNIENNWEILINIHQVVNIFIQNNPKYSDQNLLVVKEKILQEKNKQLEQANKEQNKTIENLKNNLEKSLNDNHKLTKQLLQVQSKKNILLKILSTDLKQQQENLSDKEQNNYKLHQQLTAQIQVLTKN